MPSEIDPDSRLMGGWEPAPIPARTPNDILPAPPRVKLPVVHAPTLCEQGPCSHYHKAVIRFDAATPMDGSEAVDRTQTIRTCIPGAGVMLELEDKPVFECTFWDPDWFRQGTLLASRKQFAVTEAGEKYRAELAAWRDDQARIHAQVERDIANPPPELGPLEKSLHELKVIKGGGTLELRYKGEKRVLARMSSDDVMATLFDNDGVPMVRFDLTQAEATRLFRHHAQISLRLVNSDGAICSTRIITLDPKETPIP